MGKASSKKRKNSFRRKNAKLYPLYKMFSWDLLFYYSIEYLFFTITKGLTPSEILFANALYYVCKMFMEIPAIVITDFLGRRKSIIIGNILLIIHLAVLVFMPGMMSIVISNLIFSLGYAIKGISEENLLYDSVATKGGEGLYSKLDSKGGSWYYILDGIASLTAGYLFVINNYLPMAICFAFLLISTILSCGFKDIYDVRAKAKSTLRATIKEYIGNLKVTIKFIFRSNRMRAFIFFKVVLYSLICILNVYDSDLLVTIGIPEEQFSMIFAVLTLIGGVSIAQRKRLEQRFKNRTLTFISLVYVFGILIVGLASNLITTTIVIPIVLCMFVFQVIAKSMWYVLEGKYLKNFTQEEDRSKISFTYQFIGEFTASVSTCFAGVVLNLISIEDAYVIVGLIGLFFTILALDYMRTRFGLKPEEYDKKDLYIR